MGLLTILKKMKQKEKEIRLLMLGLDNAGKTTILKRFIGEDINKIEPTLGFNIQTLEHRGFKLNVWDIGDSADKWRLDDCKTELHQLLQEERLAGATLLVFANKQDLPGALSGGELRQELDLDSIRSHHWHIQWCSAVSGEKLLDGIDWIIADIASRIFTLE
ncbi:ADP-ribosylation factor-like protein 2 isoform X2 [Corticium candelabrum]|uniref:ADP-ribosylation factor-like protein 2 isoform X2 n=1 Tax=Corticium candelabrum TaxID=121492 RepID=UPI002E26E113|nr:ADP-ribosylation factor-like protein 2 isoform X2 [Corticium candelabrum]